VRRGLGLDTLKLASLDVRRPLIAAAFFLLARTAFAQNPVRLPAVQVSAPLEKPRAHAMIGVVHDTAAMTLEGAEISIVDLKRRVFSGSDGKFRIDDLRPGRYAVRVRRVGYAPQVRSIDVDDDGGVGEFALLPIPRTLQPVVVNAGRGGLSGIIGDTAFRALRGAVVRVLGSGRMAETDSTGHFRFDVRPGQYFLSVQRDGFGDQTMMVRVPKDSGRFVAVHLAPRTGKRDPRSVYNITDLATRMASRMTTNSTVYSTDDLAEMGIVWVGDAVQGAVTRTALRTSLVDDDCFAVLNGGPDIISLKGLTRDDIVSMEVYAMSGGVASPVVPSASKSSYTRWPKKFGTAVMGLTNTKEAGEANFYGGKRCPLIYIWKR
jgi:hypothetical protein